MEKWLLQVQDVMLSSVHDVIESAHEVGSIGERRLLYRCADVWAFSSIYAVLITAAAEAGSLVD